MENPADTNEAEEDQTPGWSSEQDKESTVMLAILTCQWGLGDMCQNVLSSVYHHQN